MALQGNELVRVDYAFPPTVRSELLRLLRALQPNSSPKAYLDSTELLVGRYRALLKSRGESTPEAKARTPLKNVRAAIARLDLTLNALASEPQAAQRLDLAADYLLVNAEALDKLILTDPRWFENIGLPKLMGELYGSLRTLESVIDAALMIRSGHARGGRKANPFPLGFVHRLCEHYRESFGTLPPSSAEGPFEDMVAVLFREVGWSAGNRRRLVLEALRLAKGGKTAPASSK